MGDEKILTDKQVKELRAQVQFGKSKFHVAGNTVEDEPWEYFLCCHLEDALDSHAALIEKLKRIERETWDVRETGRKLK